MIKFIKKVLYYGTILPPIFNTLLTYIKATQELTKQLEALNKSIQMEQQFSEDNSDDE